MKLKTVKLLSGFRGLPAGYSIEFNKLNQPVNSVSLEPICLVGLNGSGKSNILEVVAEIFYYLESYFNATKSPRNGFQRYKTGFGFEVSYVLPSSVLKQQLQDWDELQALSAEHGDDPLIIIKKEKDEFPTVIAGVGGEQIELKNNDNNREVGVLPSRVIGYSSGMNELLSNPFIRVDFDYLNDFKDKTDDALDSKLDMNRLFYMNYDSNKYITVSNLLFDADDFDMEGYSEEAKATDFGGINLQHIKAETGIENITSFSLRLQLEKFDTPDHNYLPSELNIALDKFKTCATFCQEHEKKIGGKKIRKTIEYDYWVNKPTKESFRNQFGSAYELFRAFYFLQLLNNDLIGITTRDRITGARAGDLENLSEELPKFVKDDLRFRLHNVKLQKGTNRQIEYRKLSDGEHQLLQVVGSILLMDAPGALFLFDEPETHFNPDWRSKFVQMINSSIGNKREQELILTTHSPFVISDCKRENVFVFERNVGGKVQKAENPNIKTYGTAVSIITDEIFKKSETLSDMSLSTINDIKHMPMDSLENIQTAKEASRVLGESPEKVLLFRDLLIKEDGLKE